MLLAPRPLSAPCPSRDRSKRASKRRTSARSALTVPPFEPLSSGQVMLQRAQGAQRAQVSVHAEWLLQYPDGRVAFFALSPTPGEPPLWVPVLRLHRQRESWMHLRLNRRAGESARPRFMP